MHFSLETVQAITRLLHESDLAEISLETTDNESAPSRLTVRRQAQPRVPRRTSEQTAVEAAASASGNGHASANDSAPQSANSDTKVVPTNDALTVSATAVGMFRCSQPPLVVGDPVKLGQVVGIVESLKIPNEVVAPITGTVAEVLAEEGQAVEYGQPLLLISPSQ